MNIQVHPRYMNNEFSNGMREYGMVVVVGDHCNHLRPQVFIVTLHASRPPCGIRAPNSKPSESFQNPS
ncbi:hypothetical protein ABKN59_005182 [Abortiporus biennis]